MGDLYPDYASLAAARTEGVEYTRTAVSPAGATWASIAIHGGGIEAGSGEMAREVAGTTMRHYEFKGLLPSGNQDLHITSSNFDEPMAVDIVDDSARTLSFHGYTGDEGIPITAIGGLDNEMVERVRDALVIRGFRVSDAPSEIAGDHPNNICNRNLRSAGVQLEMSRAQRAAFFPNGDLSRPMRESGQRTAAFYAYAAAVKTAFLGRGMVALHTVNTSRYTLLSAPSPDVDFTATVGTDKLAAGGSQYLALVARYADGSNNYLARVEFSTSQSVALTIRKRVAGTETSLAGGTLPGLTHTPALRVGIRFRLVGSTLYARGWDVRYPEPAGWHATATDTAHTAPGQYGMRSILSPSSTATAPVVASWGDFLLAGPQRFTVQRSVNGITKPHIAGADIRLHRPMRLAL
ncbi:poly-gamma-glutamate hydrolase family protein [Streptomyces sp. NPDC056500]|uniref:poly-gamma-glutamate hydrolase family protein n=1 Tax=Streptomyces sp. NPDC056500 TaxID=3345840 RepID=UPI0036A1CFDA